MEVVPSTLRERQESLIRVMCREEFELTSGGVFEAKSFQVECIKKAGYERVNVCCLQKTGSGKSVASLGTLILRGGIYITVVPLLSLGATQIQDAQAMCPAVEPVHVDDLDRTETKAFLRRLEAMDSSEECIILYISPQSLLDGSPLKKALHKCIDNGIVCGVCVDEMHRLPLDARYFRKEWLCLKRNFFAKLQACKVPILAQTATLTNGLLVLFSTLTGVDFQHYEIGPVDRRNIAIAVNYCHNSIDLIKPLVKKAVIEDGKKATVLTNHSSRVVKNLVPGLRKELGSEIDVAGITGQTGSIAKAHSLVSFCARVGCQPLEHLDAMALAATKSALEGINSPDVAHVIFDGCVSDLYQLVQGIGRVRASSSDHDFRATAVLSVSGLSKLLLRISTAENPDDRKQQTKDPFQAMRLLVLPDQCIQLEIENIFGNPRARPRRRRRGQARKVAGLGSASHCGTMCPYCNPSLGMVETLVTGDGHWVKESKVITVVDFAFNHGHRLPSKLASFINSKKEYLWNVKSTDITAPHAHRLVLRMILSGILTYSIKKNENPNNDGSVLLDWKMLDESTFRYARKDAWRWRGITFPLREPGVQAEPDESESGGSSMEEDEQEGGGLGGS